MHGIPFTLSASPAAPEKTKAGLEKALEGAATMDACGGHSQPRSGQRSQNPRLGIWAWLAKAADHRALAESGARSVCNPTGHRDGPSRLLSAMFPELQGKVEVPRALGQGRGGSGRWPCHPGQELHGGGRAHGQAALLLREGFPSSLVT